MAEADQRFQLRNTPHLTQLGRAAGALVTPTGRVLAPDPSGWPERVDLDGGTERVLLPDGREVLVEPLAEGWLLRTADHAPRATRPSRAAALSLRFTGNGTPSAVLDGRLVPLPLRAAEILTALVLHPEGLTAEQLGYLLYGDDGNQTTVRVQVRRLRTLVGADVLRTRPYRLAGAVDSDFGSARRSLRAGQVAAALRACAGPLLPRSDATEVRQLREELTAGLRSAVLGTRRRGPAARLGSPPRRGRPGRPRPPARPDARAGDPRAARCRCGRQPTGGGAVTRGGAVGVPVAGALAPQRSS
jgi:hypothetical protein